MSKNRTLPYGYKMEQGRVVIDPAESKILQSVFDQYTKGVSYKRIAESLTASGAQYIAGKTGWNKNMIARIIQNKAYLEHQKYPPIITHEQFEQAQQAIQSYTCTECKEIKSLKPKLYCSCGGKILRRIKASGGERWYCEHDPNHISLNVTDQSLLQELKNQLQQLDLSDTPAADTTTTIQQYGILKQIERMMAGGHQQKEIEDQLLHLATLKYNQVRTNQDHVILQTRLLRYQEQGDLLGIIDLIEHIELQHLHQIKIIYR